MYILLYLILRFINLINCKLDLYLDSNETQRLLGLQSELYYVRNGIINTYATQFRVLIPASMTKIKFTWKNLGDSIYAVPYSISFSEIKPHILLYAPKLNISPSGYVPIIKQTFYVQLKCLPDVNAEIDLDMVFNISIQGNYSAFTLLRKKICVKNPTLGSLDQNDIKSIKKKIEILNLDSSNSDRISYSETLPRDWNYQGIKIPVGNENENMPLSHYQDFRPDLFSNGEARSVEGASREIYNSQGSTSDPKKPKQVLKSSNNFILALVCSAVIIAVVGALITISLAYFNRNASRFNDSRHHLKPSSIHFTNNNNENSDFNYLNKTDNKNFQEDKTVNNNKVSSKDISMSRERCSVLGDASLVSYKCFSDKNGKFVNSDLGHDSSLIPPNQNVQDITNLNHYYLGKSFDHRSYGSLKPATFPPTEIHQINSSADKPNTAVISDQNFLTDVERLRRDHNYNHPYNTKQRRQNLCVNINDIDRSYVACQDFGGVIGKRNILNGYQSNNYVLSNGRGINKGNLENRLNYNQTDPNLPSNTIDFYNVACINNLDNEANLYDCIVEDKSLTQGSTQRHPFYYPFDHLTLGDVIVEGTFGQLRKGILKPRVSECVAHNGVREEKVIVKLIKRNCSITQAQHQLMITESAPIKLSDIDHRNVMSLKGFSRYDMREKGLDGNPNFSNADILIYPLSSTSHGNNNNVILKLFLNKIRETADNTQRFGLTTKNFVDLSIQLLHGIKALHSYSVIHKDIASRNCFISENMILKIGDTSLSRDIFPNDYSCLGDNENRPVKWMALESLLFNQYSIFSDIWSFGVTLWEIISLGVMPYYDIDPFEIGNYLQNGYRLNQPTQCPDELYSIILSCLHIRPENRPNIEILLNLLLHFQKTLDNFI
ncbi:uncharacterized protein LOC135925586 [Gordionus sp. m RMFG-2023]|uniref:uncharacterized protein LOC135925586 n=1 Tax=Gordionus sp. m RMFG-2023 TaxID=3053472 RepID=UPI0031FD8462